MNVLNTIFDWLLSASLRAALLVPVVLLAQWLLRKHLPADWRYALWLPVLVALLVPALPILPSSLTQRLLTTAAPAVTTVEESPAPQPSAGTLVSDAPATPLVTQPPLSAERSLPSDREIPGFAASAPESTSSAASPAMTGAHPPAPIDWRALALWAWLVGAVAVGFLILASFIATMRRVKRTALPVRPDLLARVAQLAAAAGLRRVPRVWRSPAVSSPSVCGLWRPVLLINERFEEVLSEDETDLILRHELAHIRRGDLPLNALVCTLLAVHWFNPLLWLAFFRARADREAACDESVLRGEPAARRVAYGHTLLKMETAFAPSGMCLGFAGILQGRGTLRTRIQSIIARRKLNLMSVAALATGIALVTVLGVTGIGAEPKTDETTVQTPADGDGEKPFKHNPKWRKWQKDLGHFLADLGKITETAKIPEEEELIERLDKEDGDLDCISDSGGIVDFNPAEGTVQHEINKKYGGPGGAHIDWEFDLAYATKIYYDQSTRLIPEIGRVVDKEKGKVEQFRFEIRILKSDDGPFKAGDRVRLKGSIDDLSRFRKDFSRALGLAAIYYLEDAPNPVFSLQLDEAEVTLVKGVNQDEGKGENRSHQDAEAPAAAEGEDNAAAAQQADPALFVVRVNGKEGFMNADGKLVIPATFEKAYAFKEGLAAVQVNERWGFIDPEGRMVIEPRFAIVGFFSEGLAAFRTAFNRPWGYINRKGEVVLEPRFDTAEELRKGVAKVGFETTRGKLLAYLADARLVPLNYRFIDRTGAFVADPGPTRFATGTPGELIPFSKDDKFGYVDATGKVVIPPQFASVLGFSEGLACASKGGLYGFIDKTGEFVIPPRFPYANDFSEGLAGVPLGDKAWGFIDRTGKVVIPPRFNWIYGGFRHGIVEVALDGKAGFINTKGEWVWPPSE